MMLCSPTSLPSCLQSSLASERALDGQPSYPWWQKAAGPGTLGGHSPRGILSHHPWSHFPCLRDVQSSPSLLSRETQHPDALGGGGGWLSEPPHPGLVSQKISGQRAPAFGAARLRARLFTARVVSVWVRETRRVLRWVVTHPTAVHGYVARCSPSASSKGSVNNGGSSISI